MLPAHLRHLQRGKRPKWKQVAAEVTVHASGTLKAMLTTCQGPRCVTPSAVKVMNLRLVVGYRRVEGGGKGSSSAVPLLLAEPQEKWDLCRHTTWPERQALLPCAPLEAPVMDEH